MNKTVFFKTFRRLFGFVLAISLSASVLTAQAQNARITLNLSDVPMSQVMKEIEKQTRYLFINKGVDTGKKLSVNLTQKTIQEVLDYVLKNTDITYKIDGTYIILAEKAAEKPVAVTGKVCDVNGVPVIGASVVVKGTTVGTSTDMDGTFSLQVPPPPRLRPSWRLIFWGTNPSWFPSATGLPSTSRFTKRLPKSRASLSLPSASSVRKRP